MLGIFPKVVKIAIVDKGIDKTHLDLIDNISELSFNTQTGYPFSGFDPYFDGVHGTHVAGIIAAIKNNSYGIAGVAPKAKLMSVSHHLGPSPTASEEFADGINWAWESGADIINNSWGDKGGVYYDTLHSAILENAIINAMIQGREGKGSIVVFASGNESLPDRVSYPGNFHDDILVVGANDPTGSRWIQSNYADQLDVVAPGVDIWSTASYLEYTNKIIPLSGTSMAAPHVAGVAALILSVNPDLTGQQVRNIIESTAQKVRPDLYDYQTTSGRPNGTWHEEMGYGLVDAYAAVLEAQCYSNLPVVQGTIAQNTTWNTPKRAIGAITIPTGVTLTVSSQVRCEANVSIIVQPKGKLVIDGGMLTSGCDGGLWQGITVSGLPKSRGEVRVINNGTIENASCAITANAYSDIIAEDANFVNNTVGVFLNTNTTGGVFKRTIFELNNRYLGENTPGSFGDERDFIAHLKIHDAIVTVEGCTLSSTASNTSSNNYGIEAVNADITVKEHCPVGCGYICQGCFCSDFCRVPTNFNGFNTAVLASNTGTLPKLKVRNTLFVNNLEGIVINGINNHELINNQFELTKNGSYGVITANSTGYKIEENSFYDVPLPAPNKITVGLTITNSGTAENEVYKNTFKNLYAAQNFLSVNAAFSSSGVFSGLQTLCNTFANNQFRDIHIGAIKKLPLYNNNSIRFEQGSALIPAGNLFDNLPVLNIDNSKSQLSMTYYCRNSNNEYPLKVSNNVTRYPINYTNNCPSKIGGTPMKSSEGFAPYLTQYDEWNTQYEYWLARANEMCGVGTLRATSLQNDDDECSAIWGMVSHYSALKDNYFNAIIVAAMSNYELRITNYEFEGEINGRISPSNFEGVPEGRGSLYEKLRFLFSYRGQYGDYLSIAETFLAENNYSEAMATLTQMPYKFKLTEEQVSELAGLRIYTQWLQQLEEQQNSIYTLSENELEYLVNYTETQTGRGVVFARNILCGLYEICLEEGNEEKGEGRKEKAESRKAVEQKSRKAENSYDLTVLRFYGLEIFPNPTTGELQIQSSKLKVQSVEIYDVYGRKIQSFSPSALQSFNISAFPAGVYFVKISTETGIITKKIIKINH